MSHPHVDPGAISPLLGIPVLVITKEGARYPGILSSIDKDKLVLNASSTEAVREKTVKTKGKPGTSKKRKVSGTIAGPSYPLFPPIGPEITVDLKSVTFVAPLMP